MAMKAQATQMAECGVIDYATAPMAQRRPYIHKGLDPGLIKNYIKVALAEHRRV